MARLSIVPPEFHHPTSQVASVVLALLSLVQRTLFSERRLRISRVADHSQWSTCHAFQPRSSSVTLVWRITKWRLPGGVTCRPTRVKAYKAKSLQLTFTAYCLAHTVLNVWSYPRLPDACYPVADLPCRDGILTRWNDRPGSAALPRIRPMPLSI